MAESAITPLIVAAAAGEEDMVRMLLPAPAPVHHAHLQNSHLHAHLYSQVRMLLMLTKQKGQSVDALHHDKSAMTALMAASSNGSLTVLHIILEAGAKVNHRATRTGSGVHGTHSRLTIPRSFLYR